MKVKLLVFYEVVWKICVKTTRLPNIKLQSRKKSRPFISISKDLEMQCCQLQERVHLLMIKLKNPNFGFVRMDIEH